MLNFGKYKKSLSKINESKLLLGLGMIILNIFSKHIELKFSKTQEAYIKSSITREIFIFTAIFVGTHDIIISVLMTSAFIIMSNTIFNENSRFCIIPNKYTNLHSKIDTNKDSIITDEEIKKAENLLHLANQQNNLI